MLVSRLFLLILTLAPVYAQTCTTIVDCNVCTSTPDCGWCGESGSCLSKHDAASCVPSTKWLYPDSKLQSSTQEPQSLVNPIKAEVYLREGHQYNLEITVQPNKALPLNVMLLQDLSVSFGDDLPVLAANIDDIINAIYGANSDLKFGVASFVDKPFPPYGIASDYVYKLDKPLLTMKTYMTDIVNIMNGWVANGIKDGGDYPECQMEALLEITKPAVGWNPWARKMVLVSTDAPFHVAGEGYTADIHTPSEGYMIKPAYTNTLEGMGTDFPSVSAVGAALKAASIVPAFAVTADQTQTYNALVQEWGFGFVEQLSANSDNLATAMLNALSAVGSTCKMSYDINPYNIIQKIDPVDGYIKGTGFPSTLTFTVELLSAVGSNVPDGTVFTLSIPGFGSTEVTIRTGYTCDCSALPCPGTPQCSGNGTCHCGRCFCEYLSPFQRPDCSCSGDPCVPDNDCSFNGICQCGECKCEQGFEGADCSCWKVCPTNEAKVPCSGNGVCECGGKCKCNAGWTGDNCGCSTANCTIGTNNITCSGNGVCDCGVCVCDSLFGGKDCGCPVDCGAYDGCSGHGYCDCGNCKCEDGWGWSPDKDVNDCSCRLGVVCPGSTAEIECSGHGECVCGECRCAVGFTGPDCACSLFPCPSNSDGVECSGHGECLCGECLCDTGYTQADCSCNEGKLCDEDCGHGECKCGECRCTPGWSFIPETTFCNCSETPCPGETGDCGGPTHGECICGMCHCNTTAGWTGDDCMCDSNLPCEQGLDEFGVMKECSGNGECECGEKCLCEASYSGTACDCKMFCEADCSNTLEETHGTCVCGECQCVVDQWGSSRPENETNICDCDIHTPPLTCKYGEWKCGQCVCDPTWNGTLCDCSIKPCGATDAGCNGHGNCNCTSQECECYEGWASEPDVEDPSEEGKNFGDCLCNTTLACPGDCSGHGECKCGLCRCDKDWTGDDCNCTTANSCRDPDCSGNGECLCGVCVCKLNYDGDICQCHRYNETIPQDQRNCRPLGRNGKICSGHGFCGDCDECACMEGTGWTGKACERCDTRISTKCADPCVDASSCEQCVHMNVTDWEEKQVNCTWCPAHSIGGRCVSIENSKLRCGGQAGARTTDECKPIPVEEVTEETTIIPETVVIASAATLVGVLAIGVGSVFLFRAIVFAKDELAWRKFLESERGKKWASNENALYEGDVMKGKTANNPLFDESAEPTTQFTFE